MRRCVALWLLLVPLACSDDDAADATTTGARGSSSVATNAGSGASGSGGSGGATSSSGSGGAPDGSMSFFVTSVGNGTSGGNYGGLTGADGRCQDLADAAGSEKTWRAYLSTHPDSGPGTLIHARGRIGRGPWFNFRGAIVARDLAALHADGVDPALIVDEQGNAVPSEEHDILTGSQADGTSFTEFPDNPSAPPPTCANWTSLAGDAYTWVGHSDPTREQSWNSQHPTTCSPRGL